MTRADTTTRSHVGKASDLVESEEALDSELESSSQSSAESDHSFDAEYYRRRIDEHEADGPATARHSEGTKKLVKREMEHWEE